MPWRLTSVTCFTGVAAMALVACSSDNSIDCKYACEQVVATGPYIEITHNGASIAAIETLAPGGTSDASDVGGCAVSWSSLAFGQAQPVCPALPVDGLAMFAPNATLARRQMATNSMEDLPAPKRGST